MLFSRPFLIAAVCMVAVVAGVVIAEQELAQVLHYHASPWILGFLSGVGLASCGWGLWMLSMQVDGSWSWRLGADAESATSTALQKLGPSWQFEFNVTFYGGRKDNKAWVTDIDCVAVGPPGVLAISTKWTGDRWDLNDPGDPWIVAAARQAARNARRLEGRVRHRVPEAAVIPAIVCWGPRLPHIEGVITRVPVDAGLPGPVRVLSGAQASEWRSRLASGPLTNDQITAAHDAVTEWVDEYNDLEARNQTARNRAGVSARRANVIAVAIAIVDLAVATFFVSADLSRQVARSMAPFARFGGGFGAFLLLVVPTLGPPSSLAFSLRARRRCERARLKRSMMPALMLAACSFATWVITMAVLLA